MLKNLSHSRNRVAVGGVGDYLRMVVMRVVTSVTSMVPSALRSHNSMG